MTALPPDPLARTQPHNLDAEQELLGAILVNNHARLRFDQFLKAEHFFHEAHRRIYTAALTLIERGEIASPVTLKGYFEGDEVIAKAGGTVYLARLAAAATTVINAEDYARVIHDLAMRREVIGVAEQIADRAYDPKVEEAATGQIEAGIAQLQAIPDEGRTDEHKPERVAFIAERVTRQVEAIANGQTPPGLRCGIREIDRRLGGLHPQDLIILAGRPSMGKTALAIEIGVGAARNGHPTAFFSGEQGKEAVTQRILSRLSGVPYENMRTGEGITVESARVIRRARDELQSLPLYIDDTGARTPASIQSEILRMSIKNRIELAFFDYLQIGRSGQRLNNPVAEVTAISQGLKGVAKKLRIPFIALSQLSRAVESRDDKRPQLSDLRESGAIEQDADVIAFVYREAYYHSRKQPSDRTSTEWHEWNDKMLRIATHVDFLIQKNRMGRIGVAELECDLAINKFTDRVITHEYPEGYGGRY